MNSFSLVGKISKEDMVQIRIRDFWNIYPQCSDAGFGGKIQKEAIENYLFHDISDDKKRINMLAEVLNTHPDHQCYNFVISALLICDDKNYISNVDDVNLFNTKSKIYQLIERVDEPGNYDVKNMKLASSIKLECPLIKLYRP